MRKNLVYEDESICIFKAIEVLCSDDEGYFTVSRLNPIHIASIENLSDGVIKVTYYFKEIKWSKKNI